MQDTVQNVNTSFMSLKQRNILISIMTNMVGIKHIALSYDMSLRLLCPLNNFNVLRLIQNCHHLEEPIFKLFFVKELVYCTEICSHGSDNNSSILVLIMIIRNRNFNKGWPNLQTYVMIQTHVMMSSVLVAHFWWHEKLLWILMWVQPHSCKYTELTCSCDLVMRPSANKHSILIV